MIVKGSFAKRIDRYAIKELGISSLKLMEGASEALSREVMAMAADISCRPKELSLAFFCGTGNNGADGLNCADILYKEGFKHINIIAAGDPKKRTDEFLFHEERLREQGIELSFFQPEDMGEDICCSREGQAELLKEDGDILLMEGKRPDIIIDAVFGIGLRRRVEGVQLRLIELMNGLRRDGARIVAADVPSGIDADLGLDMCAPGTAVKADVTVSFGYGKTGLYLGDGPSHSGRIVTADIGYPEWILEKVPHNDEDMIETSEDSIEKFQYKLKHRGPDANKGSYGKFLVIAGSKGMAGAAYLSGLSAFRSGAGMIRYFGPEENRSILQTLLPEAMYTSFMGEDMRDKLREAFIWADHFILGPGLSVSENAKELLECFSELWAEGASEKRLLLIDADGLNILAGERRLQERLFGEKTVITPHVGEMARLTKKSIPEIKKDLMGIAKDYAAASHVNVVLKDAYTAIADVKGSCCLNTAGSAALAKAGSGDVLSGTIGGICAVLGDDIPRALPAAVYIHAKAGERAGEVFSEHGTLARDVAECIPKVFMELG